MDDYKKRLALILAETGALFFDRNLFLKDGRPTPYFLNMAMFRTGRLSLELGSFFAAMMVSQDLAKDTDILLGPSYRLQEKDFGLRYRSEFLVRRTGSTPPRIPPSGLAKIIFLKPIQGKRNRPRDQHCLVDQPSDRYPF